MVAVHKWHTSPKDVLILCCLMESSTTYCIRRAKFSSNLNKCQSTSAIEFSSKWDGLVSGFFLCVYLKFKPSALVKRLRDRQHQHDGSIEMQSVLDGNVKRFGYASVSSDTGQSTSQSSAQLSNHSTTLHFLWIYFKDGFWESFDGMITESCHHRVMVFMLEFSIRISSLWRSQCTARTEPLNDRRNYCLMSCSHLPSDCPRTVKIPFVKPPILLAVISCGRGLSR